jgi:hypothetical protein
MCRFAWSGCNGRCLPLQLRAVMLWGGVEESESESVCVSGLSLRSSLFLDRYCYGALMDVHSFGLKQI